MFLKLALKFPNNELMERCEMGATTIDLKESSFLPQSPLAALHRAATQWLSFFNVRQAAGETPEMVTFFSITGEYS